jgi:hypothetical protein
MALGIEFAVSQRVAVAQTAGQLGNPEEGERPPLEEVSEDW